MGTCFDGLPRYWFRNSIRGQLYLYGSGDHFLIKKLKKINNNKREGWECVFDLLITWPNCNFSSFCSYYLG